MSSFPPFPIAVPIARPPRDKYRKSREQDPLEGRLTPEWELSMTQLSTAQGQTPVRVKQVTFEAQTTSIAATDLSNGTLASGMYSVAWYVRVTTPASVSSSIQVTLSWTDRAQVCTISGAALTGNLVTTLETSGAPLIFTDQLAPVNVSTTYASVGTPMIYAFRAILTKINA